MARRVGSLRALKPEETWLAVTNGKDIITINLLSSVNGAAQRGDNRCVAVGQTIVGFRTRVHGERAFGPVAPTPEGRRPEESPNSEGQCAV